MPERIRIPSIICMTLLVVGWLKSARMFALSLHCMQPMSGKIFNSAPVHVMTEQDWTLPWSVFWGWPASSKPTYLYFDVRFFNLYTCTASNRHQSLSYTCEKHEMVAYEQCIQDVRYGNFIPCVMSLSGGVGNTTVIQSLLQTCSTTAALGMRCRLFFAILRSPIQCNQGVHSTVGQAEMGVTLPKTL